MNEERFQAENVELDQLFQQYRAACPEVEPGPLFMPALWQRIEGRRSVWFRFGQMGTNALAVSAALCLLLLVMNLAAPPQVAANYADALFSDDSTEQVAYNELVRPQVPEPVPAPAH